MTDRITTADASCVTMSEFLAAMLGEPEETISSLVGELFIACRDGNAEEEAILRAKIRELSHPRDEWRFDDDPETGNPRIAA